MEPPKKTEDLETVRRVQEKLAAKKEQQQREREAERALEEAKNAERELERERLKQERLEKREKLKVEREEAKAKGPEEYERWRQARRTMSCNSETADADMEPPQLYPNLMSSNPSSESIASNGNNNSSNDNSDTNVEPLADTDAMLQQASEPPPQEDDEMSFHPPQESEFMTNYTSEPIQYPWQPAPQVRPRAPPGMMQQPPHASTTWTCACSLINAAPALSCARCGVFRFQAESAERNLSFLSMDQPRFGASFQQQEAVGPFGGWGGAVVNGGNKLASPIIEPSRNIPPPPHHLEGLDHMNRSHSSQQQAPFPPQQGHGNGLLAASRFPSSDSGAMFRHFDPQRGGGLGNGVFEVPPPSSAASAERSHFVPEKPAFRTVDELLESLNLSCLSSIFSAEDIDLAALKLLKNSHLTDMGIKLGPRVKLMKAIESL